MAANGLISLVVTTYNRPDALKAVLTGCLDQTDDNYEIVVADDGSTPDTAAAIAEVQATTDRPILHVWHPDDGFRAAAIRNKGVLASHGDYVVFLDGDCVPQRTFVARHRQLALPGCLVTGSRILLNPALTARLLADGEEIQRRPLLFWFGQRLAGRINKFAPLLATLPQAWRRRKPRSLRGVKSCNLAVWRADLIAVDGMDESFVGWGHEDADLVARLYNYGVRRTHGFWSTEVFHLWHREQPRDNDRENYQKMIRRLTDGRYLAERGMAGHKSPA
jgi:glycosyltransferase involved in cell wall biosynthesis